MTFLQGLGFLALIGIPILIIIYILKPKYQERKISSTYIWKLSLKYRKRRLPLQWLKSFLLIVQCVLCAVLAFLIARPAIEHKNDYTVAEKVVILDASASMMTESNGKTRFDRAIEEVNKLADKATTDYPITVITVKDTASVVVDQAGSPSVAKELIRTQKPEGTKANYSDAVDIANGYLNRNATAEIIMITDHDFEKTGYINLINVAQDEWNFAIMDAYDAVESDEKSDDYGETILIADLISYNKDVTVTPCVDITYRKSTTGVNDESSYVTVTVKLSPVNLVANTHKQIKFDYQSIRAETNKRLTSFRALRFYCLDTNGNEISDGFVDDDVFCVYGGENTNFKVQYVYSDPTGDNAAFFTQVAISAQGNCDIDAINVNSSVRPVLSEGYDIYIYQNYVPSSYPVDGAIWILQPMLGADYSRFGFTIGGEITSTSSAKLVQDNIAHPLLKEIREVERDRGQGVFNYTRYIKSNISEDYLTPLVSSSTGDPLIMGGYNENRIPVVVFSFKMSTTDFVMIWENFPQMFSNMVGYSARYTLDSYLYSIGDKVEMSAKPNAAKLVLSVGEDENKEDIEFTEFSATSGLSYTLKRGGVYTLTQYDANDNQIGKTVEFFTRCDPDESNFNLKGGTLVSDEFIPSDGEEATINSDVSYTDLSKWFAIALIALIVIEWGLQYREQY
ncbi:MAG: VWA domain-containing protein [Christensenellaceae bacterium]